ncbi:MAG: hypothetical protein FRX49_05283 [Trebouxia sp. A1-2]|nr:MAG: hypothetical protein FRX49_05283 [Trebouxia sp. A1-2]
MERSYSGMNSAYYVGMESAFYCPPEKFTSSDLKEYLSGFDTSPTSGSSSNTATQMTGMEDLPEDAAQEVPVEQAQHAISAVMDRPLPIRKRQRKPMKKSRAELEAESAPVVARRKPGRKPKATSGAVGRPKRDASAVEAPMMELGRRLVARLPAPPALPRELPARFTPKKMWAEDEEDAAPRRGRAVGLARTESDYSPAASPVRRAKAPAQRSKQSQEGRPPAPKGQKEGGPCAVCFATKSATWRRGAQGGKHSGEPLCNKCGVWEFRHPDSPPRDEMDIERGVISRRGSSFSGASQAQEHPMLDAASKKRSASGSFAEPTAKRWQIGAFQGGGIGNVSNNSSVWGAAIAAGLSEDGKHESEGSEMADGLSRLQSQHNGIRLKVKLSRAASVQKAEVMDESGDA